MKQRNEHEKAWCSIERLCFCQVAKNVSKFAQTQRPWTPTSVYPTGKPMKSFCRWTVCLNLSVSIYLHMVSFAIPVRTGVSPAARPREAAAAKTEGKGSAGGGLKRSLRAWDAGGPEGEGKAEDGDPNEHRASQDLQWLSGHDRVSGELGRLQILWGWRVALSDASGETMPDVHPCCSLAALVCCYAMLVANWRGIAAMLYRRR